MPEMDLNSLSKFEIMRRFRLSPSQAERIVTERARKPFEKRADFDARMKNQLPDEVRARILGKTPEPGAAPSGDARERLIMAVDRYADLVLALPLSSRGREELPGAMSGLKLAVRRLIRSPEDGDAIGIADKLLERLEFNLELLEEATLRAKAGRLSTQSAYRRILGLSPTSAVWRDFVLSDDLAEELELIELADNAAVEIADKIDGKSALERLLALGARNKKEIAALLALLAKALDQGWIDYIVKALEVANDLGVFDPEKLAKDAEKGGSTADCYATVFLLKATTTGGDVGDEWTLRFKVDGQEVSHQVEFGRSYDAQPLLLRGRYKIGPCGQANPVKVLFWAEERETVDSNDISLPGDVGYEVFDSPCPSQQEKEITTLVYEKDTGVTTSTSETVHATVVVFKDCGGEDITAPAV